MITTVTTTTTTAILNSAVAASLALMAILALIGLLVQKQLISGRPGQRAKRFSRVLNVAIVPLGIICFVAIAVKIADMLP